MAQVHGFLREDATHGEITTLRLLQQNLPKEFSVYVECPLNDKRQLRYPDFIVLTNYGVIVLEVKDWVQIEKVDRYGAEIRTRANQRRHEVNPVTTARDYAILLSSELKRVAKNFSGKTPPSIPWGFAVVLPNLPISVVTQLQRIWGKEFVINRDYLDPVLIIPSMKNTLPKDKIRPLSRTELDYIRAAINPSVYIEQSDKPNIILDSKQEQIITEPVQPAKKVVEAIPEKQLSLIEEQASEEEKQKAETEVEGYLEAISQNKAIRLVRGVAGSGKTLVLIQRARYLAAKYPEWDIITLTFNKPLQKHLQSEFKGTKIRAMTFHGLCKRLIRDYRKWKPQNPLKWLKENKGKYKIIQDFSPGFIEEEFNYIKDVGLPNAQAYQEMERKGRGAEKRLGQQQRYKIYELLHDYQKYHKENNSFDWADLPYIVLRGIQNGEIKPKKYDAVLIDEAQDFAPVWFRVVYKLLRPEGGLLFLADDPAQSIYRFYSWREKGIQVVGRTRHLKIPYRNTVEIYRAAYSLIQDDDVLQRSLKAEGLLIVPDLDDKNMRHGKKPLLQRFDSFDDEISFIRNDIHRMLGNGIDRRQIAVLHRHTSGKRRLEKELKGCQVNINTFHSYKGLEFNVVYLSQVQETFQRVNSKEEASQERRLCYMAMTRSREELYMNYEGRLPAEWKRVAENVDSI